MREERQFLEMDPQRGPPYIMLALDRREKANMPKRYRNWFRGMPTAAHVPIFGHYEVQVLGSNLQARGTLLTARTSRSQYPTSPLAPLFVSSNTTVLESYFN
jgi:hypothetical protein